jgi:hypothetical protein
VPRIVAPEKKLTETIQTRGSKLERERWEETAWRRRTTLSEMIRAFLNREARKELGPEDAPTSPASPTPSSASPGTSTAPRTKPSRGAAKPAKSTPRAK